MIKDYALKRSLFNFNSFKIIASFLLLYKTCLRLYLALLNIAMAVEECDATKFNYYSKAGLKELVFADNIIACIVIYSGGKNLFKFT